MHSNLSIYDHRPAVLIFVFLFLNACDGGGGDPVSGQLTGDITPDTITQLMMESKLNLNYRYFQQGLLLNTFGSSFTDLLMRASDVEGPCGEFQATAPTFTKDSDNTYSLSSTVTVALCTSASAGATIIPTKVVGQLTETVDISGFKLLDSAGAEIDLTGKRLSEVSPMLSTTSWAQINLRYSAVHSGTVEISGLPETRSAGSIGESFGIYKTQDPSKPCIVTANVFTDCELFLTDSIQSTAVNTANVINFKYNNIDLSGILSLNQTAYLPNGTVDFIVNNWSGTLTMGPNSPHTYTANLGDGEIQGSLPF